mgnify:FL=1|jgi:phage/plasmid-associated DNA primase|tara:strand:- start:7881 stop:10460 length:2580 start_codon:yes stop_codon:yes gene_type:complete
MEETKLKQGEIRLDLIPSSWPLTPIGENKNPYLFGWQKNPLSVGEIAEHLYSNRMKAVGLLSGPVGNEPFGLVWVDVDGPSVRGLIEEMCGASFEAALPKTLAVTSGREGRVRKLYKVPRDKFDIFIRNKYTWLSEGKEKLEILWKKAQGVIMGKHPKTAGYKTLEDEGFEHVNDLPEIPEWIIAHIAAKNAKMSKPHQERQRYVGTSFAINSEITLDRDVRLAKQAVMQLPAEHYENYETWISVGQALHAVDDSCLDIWIDWSKQSDKFKDGECERKWKTFDREEGRGLGSLIHEAKAYGFSIPQEYKVLSTDDAEVEAAAQKISEIEETIEDTYVWEEELPPRQPTEPPSAEQTSRKRQRNLSKTTFNELVDFTIQQYGGNLKFCTAGAVFRKFQETGHWKALDNYEFGKDLIETLDLMVRNGIIGSWTRKMVDDLKLTLCEKLAHDEWYEGDDYLLFTNGLLKISTMEFSEITGPVRSQCRQLYLIHQQPYPYLPEADCPQIKEWLAWTQYGHEDRVQLLRAYMRAVLLQAQYVQMFLELIGYGRTGKSSFANLCVALVGRDNTASTHFREMESNKFELCNFAGKKLILLPDQDKWGGTANTLKALTGDDMLRGEVKYKANTTSYQYKGMVIITANSEIQSNDKTTGLQRRRITLYFNRVYKGRTSKGQVLIDFAKNGNPQGKFAAELPGLTNWLLSMTDEDMVNYLCKPKEYVKSYKAEASERDRRVSPVHDWLHEHVVFAPGEFTALGRKRKRSYNEDGNHVYANWSTHLYPSYLEYTEGVGNKPVNYSNFKSTLIEICETNELPVKEVVEDKVQGMSGLKLRNGASTKSNIQALPSLIDYINDPGKYKNLYES